MNAKRILLITGLVTVVVWGWISRPLPRFVASGIPASSRNIEQPSHRRMIEGDHLQLMYHFWLFADMLRGRTPWFHNRYEFNVGNDEDRKVLDPYYFPFSLVFALFDAVGGMALGWNATGFLALWLTYWATWLLIAALVDDHRIAAVLGALSILMPYRWMNVLGGSPTGFAMLWIPLLMLGMEAALRRRKAWGGWLAAGVLLCASWTDLHVFFFSGLLLPPWFVLCLILPDPATGAPSAHGELPAASAPDAGAWAPLRSLWSVAAKRLRRGWHLMLPLAGAGVFIVLYTRMVRRALGETLMGEGRSLQEAGIFSQPLGAFRDTDSYYFMGFAALLLALLGLAVVLMRLHRADDRDRRLGLLLLILLGAVAGIMLLACGPRGPRNGQLFVWARMVIPHYIMIRQPAKILSLLPTLLALAGAIGVLLLTTGRNPRWRQVVLIGLAGAFVLEYGSRVEATICLLDREQPAYQAIAEDAEADGRTPRALAIVLWPGDSHYTSTYQYYASLYRIRLVNGYSPSVSKAYFESVFRVFESMNQGHVEDAQLDRLLEMGVDYLILHQNLFPAQVSPFRVAFTLRQFLNHERLELLANAESVWAFRIRRDPRPRSAVLPQLDAFFPTRVWMPPHLGHSGDRMQALNADHTAMRVTAGETLSTRRVSLSEAPNLRWMLRLRGEGARVRGATRDRDGRIIHESGLTVDAETWSWFEIPLDSLEGFHLATTFELTVDDGWIDAGVVLVTAGQWTWLEPGESVDLPASLFFHDGYTDLATAAVHLRKAYERANLIFHGPDLPLHAGHYEVEIAFGAEAPPETRLGRFAFVSPHGVTGDWHPVVTGHRAIGSVQHTDNLPLHLTFHFDRAADMTIETVTIRRIE